MTDRDALIARLRAIGQDMGVVASVLMRTARDGNDDQKSIERLNAWRGEILAVMDALSTPPPADQLPPRPTGTEPVNRPDLVRYGVTWDGDSGRPLLTPMADGYWTPWHLAASPPADLVALAQEFVTLMNTIWKDNTPDGKAAKFRADARASELAHLIMAYPLPAWSS